MSNKLNNVLSNNFHDIYSIMEQGPYVRTCDENYPTKFEELEKKNEPNDIVLIDDHRKNSKGKYGSFSWTTRTNIANSIAKCLVINTDFIEDCEKWASIKYDIPSIDFCYDDEYELAFLLKNLYSDNLVTMVYACDYLYNSQVKLDSECIPVLYDFLETYRKLVFDIVDYIYDKYYQIGGV